MNYKVTYIAETMTMAFIRVSDDAILYSNAKEAPVIEYAKNFGKAFWIE